VWGPAATGSRTTFAEENKMISKIRLGFTMQRIRKNLGMPPSFWWWKMYLRWAFTGKLVKPAGTKVYGQEEVSAQQSETQEIQDV
jgi:hypothetical protein